MSMRYALGGVLATTQGASLGQMSASHLTASALGARHHHAMDYRSAIARLTDDNLAALAHAIDEARPGPSPNLLEWLGPVVDRERHRRIGVDLAELPLDEALPVEESAAATAVAIGMRDAMPAGAVRDLLAAIVSALSVGTRQ